MAPQENNVGPRNEQIDDDGWQLVRFAVGVIGLDKG